MVSCEKWAEGLGIEELRFTNDKLLKGKEMIPLRKARNSGEKLKELISL